MFNLIGIFNEMEQADQGKKGLREVNSDIKENKGGGNLRARPCPAKVSTY